MKFFDEELDKFYKIFFYMYSIRSNDNTVLPLNSDQADSKELMESVESAENYDFLSSSLNENAELAENKIEVISFKKI